MRIGVLTGGGDAPGLNAAIRAITRKAVAERIEVIGFRNGWLGALTGSWLPLNIQAVTGILPRAGTILGSSRTNPYKREDGPATVKRQLEELGVDAMVPIGGEDTLGVAAQLSAEGVKLVGVPKTIDNDLYGTEFSIGFDTAVEVVRDSLDKLHPTAEAHDRIMVVEVMGRHAGWLATVGGLAGAAHAVLIPEQPFSLTELIQRIKRRHEELGKMFSLVVVSEGAKCSDWGAEVTGSDQVDEFGHVRLGGIGHRLAVEMEARTGFETREVVLGHLQRGGSPSAFDRVLATRLGVEAVKQVQGGNFGVMVGLQGGRITTTNLQEIRGRTHDLDMELYGLTDLFY